MRARGPGGIALVVVALLGALLAPLPSAAALSVESWHENGRFLVAVSSDTATDKLEVVVTHDDPQRGTLVDAILALELMAGERVVLDAGALPDRAYDVTVVPRGTYEQPPPPVDAPPTQPSPSPTPPSFPVTPGFESLPPLATLARNGVVQLRVEEPLPATGGYRASLAMDGEPVYLIREGGEGELRYVRSHDGGVTWEAPRGLTDGGGPYGFSGWTYWETARFWDGSLAVLYKQSGAMQPARYPWTLARITAEGALLSETELQVPGGAITTSDYLELLTMPDGRLLLFGETFPRDPAPSELHPASKLRVWRVTTEGLLQDETTIAMEHSLHPTFRALLAPDGTIHVVWSHGETPTKDAPRLWTASSSDGGATFTAARSIDVPLGKDLPGATGGAVLRDAAVTSEGALVLTVDASVEVPYGEGMLSTSHGFVVRVPQEGPATQTDMRTIKELFGPAYPVATMVEVLAHRERVWLVFAGNDDTWIAESFDGGRTYEPPLVLRAEGSPFYAEDVALSRSGVPAFATQGAACEGCFATFDVVVAIPGAEEVPIRFGHRSPGSIVDPIDLVPVTPPPFPLGERPDVAITTPEPVNGTPGPGIGVLAAAASLALLARRRIHR